MIKLPQWQFVEDEHHHWHWTCTTDHVRVVSAVSYADRTECLLDAVRTVVGARRGSLDGPHPPEVKLQLRLHDAIVRARRRH